MRYNVSEHVRPQKKAAQKYKPSRGHAGGRFHNAASEYFNGMLAATVVACAWRRAGRMEQAAWGIGQVVGIGGEGSAAGGEW